MRKNGKEGGMGGIRGKDKDGREGIEEAGQGKGWTEGTKLAGPGRFRLNEDRGTCG